MSITLNNSDFQCLQDQLVDLKTKNYELAEKTRRSQADFEAAKAKICSLQLKLEEQERDFQITSTTLRREIEAVTSSNGASETKKQSPDEKDKEEDYKTKYKKLLHKAKELQQRYEKSLEIVQQLDAQNKTLNEKVVKLEEDNIKLKEEVNEKQKQLDTAEAEHQKKLSNSIEEYRQSTIDEMEKLKSDLTSLTVERDELKNEVEKLTAEMTNFDSRLEVQAEEHRIQERKGIQIVKELKRQLASEKSKTETLQKRLETILSNPPTGTNSDLENRIRLSTSSSTNGNSSSNGNGSSRVNQDANSVGSWSFVPVKTKSSNQALNETLSLCSISSEDRETVQQPCDTKSEDSSQHVAPSIDENSKHILSATNNTGSSVKQANTSLSARVENLRQSINSYPSYPSSQIINDGMLIEEQAALVERLTQLQHDKWMLEEKLSYMEQANSSLTEDLADKSDIIKHYFMDQAIKAINMNQAEALRASHSNPIGNVPLRRTSNPSTVNHLISDQSSLKKVVNFLKERSQVSSNETENICRETTKKMQLMLEETLIKCIKLQENLDFVTSELNKLKC